MRVGRYLVTITYNDSQTTTPHSSTLSFFCFGDPDGNSSGTIISKVSALFNGLSNAKNYDLGRAWLGQYMSITNVECLFDEIWTDNPT